jgi:predicted peptidase
MSMGGFGTWSLSLQFPELFAAIVPMCGGGVPVDAWKIKDIPVWAFHGAKDKDVPVEETEKEKGINAEVFKYTSAFLTLNKC